MTDNPDLTPRVEVPPFDDLPFGELELLTAEAEAQAHYWIWRRHYLRLAFYRAREARSTA